VVSPVEPVPQRHSSILSVPSCSNKPPDDWFYRRTQRQQRLTNSCGARPPFSPLLLFKQTVGRLVLQVTEETEKMSEGEDASLCFLCALLFKNKPSEDWVYKSSGGSRGPAKLDT
jgi:hypothetical protein